MGGSPRGGVRIAGGEHRGRRLEVPASARPTVGRVREALFSIWGPQISGARVLDLYAGSGVVGLEAAGRGALEVLAVESSPRAVEIIEGNRKLLRESLLEVRRLRLPSGLRALDEQGRGFDLIFADPPYGFQGFDALLAAVEPLLAADGQFALEHSSRSRPPARAGRLVITDQRRYGESVLSFYRPDLGSPSPSAS